MRGEYRVFSTTPKKEIPQCFITLGFEDIPTAAELKKRFHVLARASHPDSGGDSTLFHLYKSAHAEAEKYLQEAAE